jgi:hypothetical protein
MILPKNTAKYIMPMNARFVKAKISRPKGEATPFVVEIIYNYYGLYDYPVLHVVPTFEGALEWLARERCHGFLEYDFAKD